MATPTTNPIHHRVRRRIRPLCDYCADHSHLTIECPGLQRDNPIAREYREKHFGAKAVAPTCSRCNEPEHSGRPLFPVSQVDSGLMCGDCLSGGTPLATQPVKQPETINYHAWQTPAYDGVG